MALNRIIGGEGQRVGRNTFIIVTNLLNLIPQNDGPDQTKNQLYPLLHYV